MPVTALMNMNGGTGKTTLSLLTALGFVEQDATVAIIVTDRDSPIFRWQVIPGRPETVNVVERARKMLLRDQVNELLKRYAYIIIDCKTGATDDMEEAAVLSDLVLIPVECIAMEKEGVERTFALVRGLRRRDGSVPEFATVFNRITTDTAVDCQRHHGVPTLPSLALDAMVPQQEAYRYLFEYGGPLSELANHGVRHLKVALEAVRALVNEIDLRIKRQEQQQIMKIFHLDPRRKPEFWTGRSGQLNLKLARRTEDNFRAFADRHGWSLAETFEQAVALLLVSENKKHNL